MSSVMDRIPEEVLQMILNHAMTRDTPFCAETCLSAVQFLESQYENNPRDPAAESVRPSPRPRYELSIHQKPHLSDWRAAVGTCRRFRTTGKIAFFSQKDFVMGPRLAYQLRNLQLTYLSVQDQRIAVKYINSIIWIMDGASSPFSFLTLSRHISAFPRLVSLDFLYGYRPGNPGNSLVDIAQRRTETWSHLTDSLELLGISVGRLDLRIAEHFARHVEST